MSIGETLVRARRDAGLSIADISSRTRIKLSVIDAIEHDDYSACGGDDRARSDITAIARVLGVDAGPLIDAYHAAWRPAGWITARSSEPIGAAQEPGALTPPPDPEPATTAQDTQDTQPITMGQPSEPITTGEPVHPFTIGESPYPVRPAETATPAFPAFPAFPAVPARTAGTAVSARASRLVRLAFADRRPTIWFALGGALLVFAALGGILLVTGATGQPTRDAVAGQHRSGGATRPVRTRPPVHSGRSPRRTRPASPTGSRHVQALAPVGIAAFGPAGSGHGDSPELARQALAGKAAAPWHSAWYTTAHFGNLQPGTGLLLDMGRPVTITSARIALGDGAGADLALRIGNAPTLASLPTVAHANGAAGVVRLKTAPARGRYVLVWFTRLPQDQAGTFQIAVYDIKLRGYR